MSDDPAKARWVIISVLRLSGAVCVAAGLAIMAGKIALPPAAGAVLAVVGLFDFAVAPLLLARRWRSPRP